MASTADTNDNEDLVYDEQQHPRRPHLHHLLQDSLPKLGLDCETYGPYVWGDEGTNLQVTRTLSFITEGR
jgi:hypothetical protein